MRSIFFLLSRISLTASWPTLSDGDIEDPIWSGHRVRTPSSFSQHVANVTLLSTPCAATRTHRQVGHSTRTNSALQSLRDRLLPPRIAPRDSARSLELPGPVSPCL